MNTAPKKNDSKFSEATKWRRYTERKKTKIKKNQKSCGEANEKCKCAFFRYIKYQSVSINLNEPQRFYETKIP